MNDRRSLLFGAGLLTRLGSIGRVAAAGSRLAARRLLGRSGEMDAQIGEILAGEFDRMKGAAMKLGQVLSYFDGILPLDAAIALRSLQLGATQLPADEVVALIEAELGKSPMQLFDAFDMAPVASASIGQVHRAQLEGRPLAVKIQYPGIAERLRNDVRHLNRLASLATFGSIADGRAITDDLGEQLLLECDYHAEAAAQTTLRSAFADTPAVRTPAVIAKRSSGRVLTTEWADGRGYYEFANHASHADKAAAAQILLQVAMRSFFEFGFANVDPHPGNYVFAGDGTVTFLDFGCVRKFSRQYVENERTVARCVLDDRREAFEAAVIASGIVADSQSFDFDMHWRTIRLQYAPYCQDEFCFTTDYLTQMMTLSGFSNRNLRRLNIRPEWIWHQRLVWGLHAVLAQMGAEGHFQSLLRDILNRPGQAISIVSTSGQQPGAVVVADTNRVTATIEHEQINPSRGHIHSSAACAG